MKFVIRWHNYGYVTKRQSNKKPYAPTATDLNTKTWTTRGRAERFLSLKDPQWAAGCVIEEL